MALSPTRLYVNSFFGINQLQEKPNSFVVELPTSLTRLRYAELVSASIPFVPISPNIPPEEGSLYLSVSGVAVGGDLDTSLVYSTPSDLVNQLNSVISSPTNGTFAFNSTTNRISYTAPNPSDPIVFSPGTNHILRRLGADLPITASISATGQYIFPCPPIVIRTTCLFIASNTITSDCVVGGLGSRQDIITQIPLESGVYGSIINYELPNDMERTETYNTNINSINLEILDDLFNPLPLCSNANINCVFALQYQDDPNLVGRLR